MNILSKKQVFMDGSTSKDSYLKIGRVGNMVVGLKLLGLAPSEVFGIEGQTVFAYKLRIAPDNTAPNKEPIYNLPADAFPNIEWQKSDTTRASLAVSMFLPASLTDGSIEGTENLLEQLENGFSQKLYTQISSHLGQDFISEAQDMLTHYLDEQIGIFCQLLKKFIEGKTSVAKAYSEDGETLSFMENSIKDALNAKKPTIH